MANVTEAVLRDLVKMLRHSPCGRDYYRMWLKAGQGFDSTTPLTPAERIIVRTIKRTVRPKPGFCYRNANVALTRFHGIYPLSYCEGFVLANINLPVPVHHAWLLLDAKVVDLTAPRGNFGPDLYFGVRISRLLVWGYTLEAKVYGAVTDDFETRFRFRKKILGV